MHKYSLLLALAALAVASAYTVASDNNAQTRPNSASKQKAVLQLFAHVHQPTTYSEIAEAAAKWDIPSNSHHYTKAAAVQRWSDLRAQGTLPKGQIFHVYNDAHLDEAVALFDLFYFADDFDTFYNTAAWARENVNEGQFVYAFSVAVLHRDDTQGLEIPPLYEIYPHFYLSSTDMTTFTQAKMQGYEQYVAKANFSGLHDMANPEMFLSYFTEDVGVNAYHAYVQLYHPFWMHSEKYDMPKKTMRGESFYYFYQQMFARYSLHRMSSYLPETADFDWEEGTVKPGYHPALKYHSGQHFPARPDDYPVSSIKSYSIADLKAFEYRIKAAIDSGFVTTQEGSKISISSHMHGINMIGNMIEGNKDSPNERYYGTYYTMLRNLFALVMDPMDKHGVAPGVMAHSETAMRDPAFYVFMKYINQFFTQYKSYLPSYKTPELYFHDVKVTDVEVDKLVTFFDYFDFDVSYGLHYGKHEEPHNMKYVARMPRLNHHPFGYKVKVQSGINTDAVVRVFIGPKAEALHTNFFGDSNVQSFGHDTYDLDTLRHYFVELDRFPVKLTNGMNVVERKSHEFTSTTGDHTSFKQMLSQAEQGHFVAKDFDNSCGFPDRLALPMGHTNGMPFSFFVMVTSHDADSYNAPAYPTSTDANDAYTTTNSGDHQRQAHPGYTSYTDANTNFHQAEPQNANVHQAEPQNAAYQAPYSCNGLMTSTDNRALGFPFDRQIQSFNKFYTPNMYFHDVHVYHQNSTDFHYPQQPHKIFH